MEVQKEITFSCRDRETLKKNAQNFFSFSSRLSLECGIEPINDIPENVKLEISNQKKKEESEKQQTETKPKININITKPSLIESIHRIFEKKQIINRENDDAIKTIKKSKISNRQKENKKKCVVRKVSTSTNQNNSVILLKNDEGVAFKKLSEFFKSKWISSVQLYEDIRFHNENCCQISLFKLEPNFSIFEEDYEKKKRKLIYDIIEIKKIPPYLINFEDDLTLSLRKEFKCPPRSGGSRHFKTAYHHFLQTLKENEKKYQKEDFDRFKNILLTKLHRNLEFKVKYQIFYFSFHASFCKKKLNNIIIQYVIGQKADQEISENGLKVAAVSSSVYRNINLNENQLRNYLENKWFSSESLYEALQIHKRECCDYQPLHFEEDKSLFQQQYENKKEKNIDLILKINDFPSFKLQGEEHSINKKLRRNSYHFTIYSCFGQKYFEQFEKEMEEKKKSLNEQELSKLRQDFLVFYHAKLDYLYTYLILRKVSKKNYENLKKN